LSFVQQPLLSANCLKKNRPQNLTYDGEIEKTVLVALVQFLQSTAQPLAVLLDEDAHRADACGQY
jgi:hypothetical protein